MGKTITDTNPFYFANIVNGAFLCVKMWKHESGTQCAEQMSVEEFGQLMGGN